MKIIHIAPHAVYDDYWGFQDNLLPKYHKKMGHDVYLLVSTRIHGKDGYALTQPGEYDLRDGIHVIRRPIRKECFAALTQLRFRLEGALELLRQIRPDFIFFHGLCSATMDDCIRYKKEVEGQGSACLIVQDNHLDYNIGSPAVTLRQKLARAYFRLYNRRSQRYVEKVYGVTPWRKQYAEDYYRIDPSKTDVLIMGADDEAIHLAQRDTIRSRIRKEFGIDDHAFLIVTGGKMNEKKKIHHLMEVCSRREDVELLVFGTPSEDMRPKFETLFAACPRLHNVGWIGAEGVYDYFLAADLVMFPGQHSVLWEQACACKVPCVFGRWPGMEHVDNGGNAAFLDAADPETLDRTIDDLRFTERYQEMKKVAASAATDIYLYSSIAEKALECWYSKGERV